MHLPCTAAGPVIASERGFLGALPLHALRPLETSVQEAAQIFLSSFRLRLSERQKNENGAEDFKATGGRCSSKRGRNKLWERSKVPKDGEQVEHFNH